MITNDNISYCSDGSYDTTDDESSTTSASSSKEENLKEVVLSKEANQGKLAFGNIAVVNSSNVHFGNKTVYEGPVTIKQFLYAKQQTISDLNNSHNQFSDDNKSCVPDSVNSNNNINLGFHPSGATISNKNNNNCNSNLPDSVIKKDLKWLQNILRQHLPLMISLSCLFLLSIIVLMSVLLTRHRTVVYPFDTNEQDQNSPTYADSWSIKGFWKKHIKLLVIAAVILVLLIISIACAVIFTYNEVLNKAVICGIREPFQCGFRTAGNVIDLIARKAFLGLDDTIANFTLPLKLKIENRDRWLPRPSAAPLKPLSKLVPYVIIMETKTKNCSLYSSCAYVIKHLQEFDIDNLNKPDISYNFLIGGDGSAYEGVGWEYEGNHTSAYNNRSIGIAFIGTFSDTSPHQKQITATKQLITIGVNSGYIYPNYKLLGNRQLRDFQNSQNSGKLLFEEIKKWANWTETL